VLGRSFFYANRSIPAQFICIQSFWLLPNKSWIVVGTISSKFVWWFVALCSRKLQYIWTNKRWCLWLGAFSSLMKYYMNNQTRNFPCSLQCQYHFIIDHVILAIDLLKSNCVGIVKNWKTLSKNMSPNSMSINTMDTTPFSSPSRIHYFCQRSCWCRQSILIQYYDCKCVKPRKDCCLYCFFWDCCIFAWWRLHCSFHFQNPF
jgi:hypothetical protein